MSVNIRKAERSINAKILIENLLVILNIIMLMLSFELISMLKARLILKLSIDGTI